MKDYIQGLSAKSHLLFFKKSQGGIGGELAKYFRETRMLDKCSIVFIVYTCYL